MRPVFLDGLRDLIGDADRGNAAFTTQTATFLNHEGEAIDPVLA